MGRQQYSARKGASAPTLLDRGEGDRRKDANVLLDDGVDCRSWIAESWTSKGRQASSERVCHGIASVVSGGRCGEGGQERQTGQLESHDASE